MPKGTSFRRIVRAIHNDPLGYGKGPSRFSDPRTRLRDDRRYGVVYLGTTLEVCFLEAFLRDQRDGTSGGFPVSKRKLAELNHARIIAIAPLRFVDLRGSNPVAMGVPSDVSGASDQTLARHWSLFFYQHPDKFDGILYDSRLSGEVNAAVFDRAVDRLDCATVSNLMKTPGIGKIMKRFQIALIP